MKVFRNGLMSMGCCAALVTACSGSDNTASQPSQSTAPATTSPSAQPTPSPRATPVIRAAHVVTTGLHVPWGLAFLPDGSALVSERTTGNIMRIPRGGGRPRLALHVPGVNTEGEGGLLGLALSPSYRTDRLIYAYMSTSSDNRIVRFTLGGSLHPILTGIGHSNNHNGGRLAFGPDDKLYATTGDAQSPSNAQNKGSLNGKILRMNPDGSVPTDNPFGNRVWTYGHRNVQGLAWDSQRRLWATEFGQNRFDEVNLIVKGHNYGWPNVEGDAGTNGGAYTNPKVTWTTDDASPSGAAIAGSTLYVAALRGECLWKVPLNGTGVGRPARAYHHTYGRIRTVMPAPDGSLWLMTSNRDGRGDPTSSDDRIVAVPR